MGKMIELTAADGHKLAAYRAEPAGKPRGAIVVIQEIFGVNSHIKSVADGYAQDGYLAIAPAMFDRLQRGYDTGYTQPEIQAGIAMMQKLDWKKTMLDVDAAVAEARDLVADGARKREAAHRVAERTGVPANAIYRALVPERAS